MNVGPVVSVGDAWRQRRLRVRRRMVDDVGRLRQVGFRWLFNHAPKIATYLPLGGERGGPALPGYLEVSR